MEKSKKKLTKSQKISLISTVIITWILLIIILVLSIQLDIW